MEIIVRKGSVTLQKTDVLILGVWEDEKKLSTEVVSLDKLLNGTISQTAKEERFKGGAGETLLLRTKGSIGPKRVLLVGLGKMKEATLETVREAAAVAHTAAEKIGCKSVVSILHGVGVNKLAARECAQAMTEGVQLAAYKFDAYKKKKHKPSVSSLVLVSADGREVAQAEQGVAQGLVLSQAALYARQLVNTPSGHMHPSELVNQAKKIAKESKGKIKMKVFDRAACERMGMHAFLGIAQGSDHPPYFVHLRYAPKGAKKHISLVGKAITFDSGGLSIKPAEGMYTMKLDMAGSATVLGVFSVITQLKPSVIVDGIFAACENMPSGKAIRPGDVVKAMNGTTIEVLHTDAEGRVTLADSLSYAVKQKPDAIVDLATLTGACMVALGEEIVGSMSNNPKLENQVLTAAANAGEKMWSLPLEKNYKRELKSEVADLKNLAGRYGGALTAGLFLQEFVNETPWVHLDIAGPSFAERPMNAYTPRGATGVGVRTLLELLRNF